MDIFARHGFSVREQDTTILYVYIHFVSSHYQPDICNPEDIVAVTHHIGNDMLLEAVAKAEVGEAECI